MKNKLIFLFLLLGFNVTAQPGWRSFTTNQFSTNGLSLKIKSGALFTNAQLRGVTSVVTQNVGTIFITNNPFMLNTNPSFVGIISGNVGLATNSAGVAIDNLAVSTNLYPDMRRFYVDDEGAVGDGVTDDTDVIQRGINLGTNGNGVVVMFGAKKYFVNGLAALPGVSGLKAILRLPDATNYVSTHIYLEGAYPVTAQITVGGTQAVPTNGTMIICTNIDTSGKASIIAGSSSAGYLNFTPIVVGIKNIRFQTRDNSGLNALHLGYVQAADVESVVCQTDVAAFDASLPTNNFAHGIIMPQNNNGAFSHLRKSQVVGYYNGFKLEEHNVITDSSAWNCYNAGIVTTGYHDQNAEARLMWVNCPNGLVFVDGANGAPHSHVNYKVNVEHGNYGKWFDATNGFDVIDTNLLARGSTISWHSIEAGIGSSNIFRVNGGDYIQFENRGNNEVSQTFIVIDSNEANLQASMLFADRGTNKFSWGIDSADTGTKDFFIHNIALNKTLMHSTNGEVKLGKDAIIDPGITIKSNGNVNVSGYVSAASTILQTAPFIATNTNAGDVDQYPWVFEGLAPNLVNGSGALMLFGKAKSTKNSAWFGYSHAGDGSDGNALSLGFYNADKLFNVFASGGAALGSTADPGARNLVANAFLGNSARITNGGAGTLGLTVGSTVLVVTNGNVLTGGSVGIGTTTPQNKLDVSGAVAIGSYAGINTAPVNGMIVSGNVGIGTVGPGAKLEVAVATSGLEGIRISGSGHSAGLGVDSVGSLFGVNLYYDGTKVFTVDSNGGAIVGTTYVVNNDAPSNGMIIQGNVGIGTNAPGARLHVLGDVIITGAQTNTALAGSGYRFLQVDDGGKFSAVLSTNLAVGGNFSTNANGDAELVGALSATQGEFAGAVTSDSITTGSGTFAGNGVFAGSVTATNGFLGKSNVVFHVPTNAPTGDQVVTASGTTGISRWANAAGGGNFSTNASGNGLFVGTVTIGSGTPIVRVLSASAALNFPDTSGGTSSDLTITVAGAENADVVALGVGSDGTSTVSTNGSFFYWVSSNDTVTVRFVNNSALTAYNPPSATFRAMVTKF